jgi:hypothetical protein
MKVGYARFTKDDQDTSQQLNALEQAGCKRVFVDRVNTVQKEFPGLETTLAYMQEGDTLVVKSLDRLGRSLKHLVDTVNRLGEWACASYLRGPGRIRNHSGTEADTSWPEGSASARSPGRQAPSIG